MPASKRYYDYSDIMSILQVSRTKAWQYLRMFERWGLAFREGKVLRVRMDLFDAYLENPQEYAAKAEAQLRATTRRRMA